MSSRFHVHSFSVTHPLPGQKISSHRLEDFLSSFGHHGLHLTAIFFISLLAAVPAAFAGTFFRLSVLWANAFRTAHPILLWGLPLAGLAVAFLYRMCAIGHREEAALMTSAVRGTNEYPPHSAPLTAPLIYAASCVSHLFGASVGCEGASVLLGGGIGSQFARWFHLSGKDCAPIVLCAMASAFAPLLGTPLTAAVFVLERCRTPRIFCLIPCLAGSFCACSLARQLGLEPFHFALEHSLPVFSLSTVLHVGILTGICALAGLGFCRLLSWITALTDRFFTNRFWAMGLGGVLLLALTLAVGTQDYCGTGFPVILKALNGQAGSWDFFLKLLFTALALGIGFKGGQIVPAFFIGASLGCVLAPILSLNPSFAASMGLVVLFAVTVRCPAASLLLALEIFSGAGLEWFCFSVLLCLPVLRNQCQKIETKKRTA